MNNFQEECDTIKDLATEISVERNQKSSITIF